MKRSGYAGKDVLELFQITKTVEDDSQALNTQVAVEARRPTATVEQERGSSSEPGMEGLGPEEPRSKRLREGAIAGVTGYVAPIDEENVEGEVQVENEGNTDAEHMDVQEMDGIRLLQTTMPLPVMPDYTSLMQTANVGGFEHLLHALLEEMDDMDKAKSARVAEFMKQMVRDQQRMAPHLRNPVLRSRIERLQALVSVFLVEAVQLPEGEQVDKWHALRPYLEEARESTDASSSHMGPPPSTGPDPIEIIDSQESVWKMAAKNRWSRPRTAPCVR